MPMALIAIALALGFAWGLANTFGWWLVGQTEHFATTLAHFVYEAELPMVLLLFGITAANALIARAGNALLPYAIAALVAAVGGELLFLATAPTAGVASCGCSMDEWRPGSRAANMLPDSLLICGFVTAGYYYRRRGLERFARLRAAQLERARLTRQTLESRLQAMQACIEPEFLFDTLAEVERRYDADPKGAERMLDDLIVYLRAALPHLRDTTSTVDKESALALAYLNIQKRRFADRVRFDIAIATDAQDAAMPPMILLPLIDHVFLRSVDVETGGGTLRIGFDIVDSQLRVALHFTGAGFPHGSDRQAEVAGIRHRLTTLYGAAARMELRAGDRDDIQLIIEIPHEPAGTRGANLVQ
jgi:hypothetical protein